MYGQIHVIARDLVRRSFGDDAWKKILEISKADDLEHFMVFHYYEDSATLGVIGACCEALGAPLDTILDLFGEHFYVYCIENGYHKMLHTLGVDLESFMNNLDALHSLLEMSYSLMQAPSFRTERDEDDHFILHYYSGRFGLHVIVCGMVRRAAKDLYDMDICIHVIETEEVEIEEGTMQSHVIFKITQADGSPVPHHHSIETRKSLTKWDDNCPSMTQETFCSIFPYHFMFDADLYIKQVGTSLIPLSKGNVAPGANVAEIFHCTHPGITLTRENIMMFINAVYVMQQMPDHAEAEPTITLKGQILWMEDIHMFIFIGSPRLANLEEMEKKGVFLADIPIYDATRELVLLNQQRIAEIEVSQKLEETTAALKRTSIALEAEKTKTEFLLYQMLPKKVADELKEGREVPAETFDTVTILFSDVVTFTNICADVKPIQVVQMLNQMYRLFDAATEKHNVYKVETIGDAYMVVGGVPERTDEHAYRVCNMGLDMLTKAGQVNSPATGLPLQIRVGIHSGTIMAGVVGDKMPRYCLFGDAVNTSSRMESHGIPGRCHVSPFTYELLKDHSEFSFKPRGPTPIKGKGIMETYFLWKNSEVELEFPEDIPEEVEAQRKRREEAIATATGSEKKKVPTATLR